ncbi:SKU5 similar 16 [Actinidia rufa]|uniref:SKU5 similar 16 n=1 Tax=Actinidia rufa TaxID=165716 RepID=A0A7J0D8X7_9ERIC|nr:SKU5 similar 16 [Actinidia rufa]
MARWSSWNKLSNPSELSWTYRMQMKDQIGTFTYFASTLMHRAAGGFGGFNVASRPIILFHIQNLLRNSLYLLMIGGRLITRFLSQQTLDSRNPFLFSDAMLINGLPRSATFTGQKGRSYLFRVSNVGLTTSINFGIHGHMLTLVEVEGSRSQQEVYESLDIHPVLTATGILWYAGSNMQASLPLPIAPMHHLHWSMKQARTIRWNLTANAARPNPRGSFHYGAIKIVRTIVLANSATKINGKLRYGVNSGDYTNPGIPLKFADFLNIPGVFNLNTIKDMPSVTGPTVFGTSVIGTTLHDFVEIIFQNNEKTVQFGNGQWNSTMRRRYNLSDVTTRYTVQVYPNCWSFFVSLDNKGMWNLRSAIWPRQYLGQQLYVRVWNDEKSLFTEYDIPQNALYCGKAHPS